MASDPKKSKTPEQINYRIWPGILVISLCTFFVFVVVYAVAYRASLVSMSSTLENLLGGSGYHSSDPETVETGYFPAETETITETANFFVPSETSIIDLLEAVPVFDTYYQRMRFMYITDGIQKTEIVEVYANADCWKVVRTDTDTSVIQTTICDGTWLYRNYSAGWEEAVVTPVGDNTLSGVIGLPSLELLKEQRGILLKEADKCFHITFAAGEETRWECMLALDTGLIMESKLIDGEVLVMSMFTEMFELNPAICRTKDFFTIPENGGLDR